VAAAVDPGICFVEAESPIDLCQFFSTANIADSFHLVDQVQTTCFNCVVRFAGKEFFPSLSTFISDNVLREINIVTVNDLFSRCIQGYSAAQKNTCPAV
jgi:hypothetical protein